MAIRRVRRKATELEEARVQRVSLVPAGANRTPFKEIKAEGREGGAAMQLEKLTNGLFARKDEAPAFAPVVAHVYVSKQVEDLDAAKAQVLAAGFKVDDYDDSNPEVHVFRQVKDEELPKGDHVGSMAVKNGEHLATAVVVDKRFMPDFDGTDFEDMVKSQGVFPGIHASMDVLATALGNAIFDAPNHEDAVEKAQGILKGFSKHVVELVRAVPQGAFKLEDHREGARKAQEWLLAQVPGRAAKGAPADPAKPKEPAAKSEDSEAIAELKALGENQLAILTAAVRDEAFKGLDDEALGALRDMARKAAGRPEPSTKGAGDMEALVDRVGEVFTRKIDEALKPIGERLDGLEKAQKDESKKAEKLRRRLPIADALEDDGEPESKADEPNDIPYIDTAYVQVVDRARKGDDGVVLRSTSMV